MYQDSKVFLDKEIRKLVTTNINNKNHLLCRPFFEDPKFTTPLQQAYLYGCPASLHELEGIQHEQEKLKDTMNVIIFEFDSVLNIYPHVNDAALPKIKFLPRGSKWNSGLQQFDHGIVSQMHQLLKQSDIVIAIATYNPDAYAVMQFMRHILESYPEDEQRIKNRIIICTTPMLINEKFKCLPTPQEFYQGKNAQCLFIFYKLHSMGVRKINNCYLYDCDKENINNFTLENLRQWSKKVVWPKSLTKNASTDPEIQKIKTRIGNLMRQANLSVAALHPRYINPAMERGQSEAIDLSAWNVYGTEFHPSIGVAAGASHARSPDVTVVNPGPTTPLLATTKRNLRRRWTLCCGKKED